MVQGCLGFCTVLSNPDDDFHGAVQFVKDIDSEKSLGIWLSCMAAHEDALVCGPECAATRMQTHRGTMDAVSTDVSYADFLAL